MIDLYVVAYPLVQYDMFSWKGYIYSPKSGKIPEYAYTDNNPLHNHVGFQHMPRAVLGRKEVDMPYGLREDLHFSKLHSYIGYVRL